MNTSDLFAYITCSGVLVYLGIHIIIGIATGGLVP